MDIGSGAESIGSIGLMVFRIQGFGFRVSTVQGLADLGLQRLGQGLNFGFGSGGLYSKDRGLKKSG